jgi:DNA-binding NarL/FixJ family response regulator
MNTGLTLTAPFSADGCLRRSDYVSREEPLMANPVVVRTLVVDDFEPWRQKVCSILQQRSGFSIVAEVADGMEAVQKATELQPDLILLDIRLPTLNGIEAAHRISRLVPAAKILFVSQVSDAEVVAAALSNGAKGFVSKKHAAIDLLPAMEAVLRGAHFVSSGVSNSHESPSLN